MTGNRIRTNHKAASERRSFGQGRTLAVLLLLASPILLSAQAKSRTRAAALLAAQTSPSAPGILAAPPSGACGTALGSVSFTGLPKGDGPPSDLLSFKAVSAIGAAGRTVPGSYWLCKPLDENSVGLVLASVMSTQITSIHVEIDNPNPTTTSLVFDFSNALVSSVALTSNADRVLQEIEFTSCDVQITANHEDGDPDQIVQHCETPGT